MKAIPTIAAAVLILGTLPATAESEAEDRKARREEARASLLDELGLEEDQRSQVEEILKAHAEKGGELFTGHRESRRELLQQMRRSRREARDQMQTLREETEGKLKEVLSDEQFTRLQELRKERRQGLRQERGGDHHAKGKRGRSHH